MMANILQEALVHLIDYQGQLYDNLRARWAASTLRYYKVLPAPEDAEVDVENVEEIHIRYVEPLEQRLAHWFSCSDSRFIR